MESLNFRGQCWVFGDNVGVDGDLMPLKFAIARETRLDVLREHAMTGLDPDVRFDKHMAGIQSNSYVRRFGLRQN